MSGHRELFPSGVEGACVRYRHGRKKGRHCTRLAKKLPGTHFTSYAPHLHGLTLRTGTGSMPFGFIFIVRQRRETQDISRYNLKYH